MQAADGSSKAAWSHESLLRDLDREATTRGLSGTVHHCFHCGRTGPAAEVPFSANYRSWDHTHNDRHVRIGVCPRCVTTMAHYGTE